MTHSSVTAKRFIHTNVLSKQHIKRAESEARKRSVYVTAMVVTLLVSLFAFLWIRIYVFEVGYRISSALNTQKELLQENRKLKIERASLGSPSRIEEIARNELGMVSPDNNQTVVIRW